MKLFHKIFLCFVVIFGIAFQGAGYLLINFTYKNSIEQEKRLAFQNFQYNQYILESVLYSNPEFFSGRENEMESLSKNFTVPVAIFGTDGKYYFSNVALLPQDFDFNEEEDDRISFQIMEKEGKGYIFVCDYVKQGEKEMYLVTQTDISMVINNQKRVMDYFRKIYLLIFCISFPIIFLLTKALTAS